MTEIKHEWLEELTQERRRLDHGDSDSVDSAELERIEEAWKDRRDNLRPGEKDEEFGIVDSMGKPLNITAPRWLCHLFGLRHRCAHVLVRWTTPGLGRVLVLQVRSWSKSDSPGHVDISVGGHVVGCATSEYTAYTEMQEELGISRSDLIGEKLLTRGGYQNEPEDRGNFYNVEWRDVYVADLIPELEAKNLLKKEKIPLASALKQYLENFH